MRLLNFVVLCTVALLLRKLFRRRTVRRYEQAPYTFVRREPDPDEETSFDWDALMRVADEYRTGSFPHHAPNDLAALTLYARAARCPYPEIAGLAQSRYVSTRLNPVPQEDRAGPPLDGARAVALCRAADERLQNVVDVKPSYPLVLLTPPMILNERPPPTPAAAPVVVCAPRIANDAQNVHDSSVVASVKSKARKTGPLSEQTFEDVRFEIQKLNPDRQARAMMTLTGLSDAEHSNFHISEREALQTTWSKIDGISDAAVKKNARETLAMQLSECVEDSLTVCSTGKIARILGAADGILESAAVPLSVVNFELARIASRTRERVLRGVGDDRARAYEKTGDDALSEEMKRRFYEEANAAVAAMGVRCAVDVDAYAAAF